MPSLDYKHVRARSRFADADLARFYDNSTLARTTVPCRICRWPADPLFGDHTGDPRCLTIGRENAALRARMEAKT